jgi:hypothetical protein
MIFTSWDIWFIFKYQNCVFLFDFFSKRKPTKSVHVSKEIWKSDIFVRTERRD